VCSLFDAAFVWRISLIIDHIGSHCVTPTAHDLETALSISATTVAGSLPKFAATTSQATGFLQSEGTEGGRRSGARRFCVDTFVLSRSVPEFRSNSDGTRHTYSTLLRSVGTEFKVMQELLRHSTLRSTLDVYTQAITLAKHAAQAAVLSLVFSCEANGGSVTVAGIK
jgi:hypothetical protein